ncbi:MAG: hypothetical protein Q9217_000252 [Psora testacea]
MAVLEHRVQAADGLLHLRYDLPHRIHTAKTYPLPSPNGSTIIVYGYEHGLRVLWKGGRPFRQTPPQIQRPKVDGAGRDDPVILDENYYATLETPAEKPEFEAEEESEAVMQTLDLPLGTEVLHLAFPMLPLGLTANSTSCPALLSQKLLMALAGSDCSVRVLTLPLTPPSPQSKARLQELGTTCIIQPGKSLFSEHILILSNGPTFQSLPRGISLTYTSYSSDEVAGGEKSDSDSESKNVGQRKATAVPRSRSVSGPRENKGWKLLIASHSADLSGLLLIHSVPLSADGTAIAEGPIMPDISQQLALPANAVRFNSALHPAPEHSQLMIIEKSAVRIFQCKPTTMDPRGSCLVASHTAKVLDRKHILDAQWLMQGKAILALFQDGEWAVWNLSNARPTAASSVGNPSPRSAAAFTRQPEAASAVVSQQETPWTTFTVEGRVEASLKAKNSLKAPVTKDSKSKFAPMTPGTRKVQQDALFTSTAPPTDGPLRVYGGLSVVSTHGTPGSQAEDEFVLLWHENEINIISSFSDHWQNKSSASGNILGANVKGEPKAIQNVDLGGERCQEVSLINTSPHDIENQPNILVTGERRVAIITSPLKGSEQPTEKTKEEFPPPLADQQLLARGELNVSGMNRILARMSNGHASRRSSDQKRRSAKGKVLL